MIFVTITCGGIILEEIKEISSCNPNKKHIIVQNERTLIHGESRWEKKEKESATRERRELNCRLRTREESSQITHILACRMSLTPK
jgi:hypothetical protein